MKVAVVTFYTRWPVHFETELEILERHLDDGDEAVHLYCGGELSACDDNPQHRAGGCLECIEIRNRGARQLPSKVTSRSLVQLTANDRATLAALRTDFDSPEALENYWVDGFDVGSSALSSVISLTRNPAPDLTVHADLVQRLLVAAMAAYRSTLSYLREHPTDRVYVFNGRLAPCRAVFRACQKLGVPCFVHERGRDLFHYALYENTTPHDLAYTVQKTRELWDAAAERPDREQIAERFYEERMQGVVQSWYSFTAEQKAGLLPADWDAARRNIAVFNSSEDEFASSGQEWKSTLYPSQQAGIEKIVESVERLGGNVHLYLRIHPNLRGVDNEQTRRLAALSANCLTVIPADDPVSSYALVQHADKVLTFGSTVGVEAVYLGTPSILAGPAYYGPLGGTYNPASHAELMELLTRDLPPGDRTAALMYGYYWNSFGDPFRHYVPQGMTGGLYRGVQLHPPTTRGRLLRRALRYPLHLWRQRRARGRS